MSRSHFKVLTAFSGASLLLLSGCATLSGESPKAYRPYEPVTPAAAAWPNPAGPTGDVPLGTFDRAQPAGYHARPATEPAVVPTTAPVALPDDVGVCDRC